MDMDAETENAGRLGASRPGTARATPLSSTHSPIGASGRRSGARESLGMNLRHDKLLPTVRSAGPALEQSLDGSDGLLHLYLDPLGSTGRSGPRRTLCARHGGALVRPPGSRGLSASLTTANDRLESTIECARRRPAVNQCSSAASSTTAAAGCSRPASARVVLESYSPCERAARSTTPTVVGIAGVIGRTPAQVASPVGRGRETLSSSPSRPGTSGASG